MGVDCLMPIASRPRTRPDGSPFTIDDREYWHLERDGGIRQASRAQFPKMVYRGRRDPETGKSSYESMVVQSEAEWAREGHAWKAHPQEAIDHYDGLQHDISKAAAEANYAALRMSPKAQAELAQANADSPEFVTDVVARKKPGPKPKVAATE
jgi:hypothetical protein